MTNRQLHETKACLFTWLIENTNASITVRITQRHTCARTHSISCYTKPQTHTHALASIHKHSHKRSKRIHARAFALAKQLTKPTSKPNTFLLGEQFNSKSNQFTFREPKTIR